MVRAQGLTRRFGRIEAVKSIDFDIKKGEIIGFLGPNGAGKSTTMNMITGYLAPSEGSVEIDGINLLDAPEQAKKKIGYLPEQPPLYADLSVNEYLNFAASFKKIPKSLRNDEIERVSDLVKMGDMRRRLIRNLSKGYKQRTGLAQALLGNPPLLILDEPTVGLDPKQIIEIRQLICDLGKDHTVVLSSHILPEISATCQRILIIDKGMIVASGSPESLSRRVSGVVRLQIHVKCSQDEATKVLESLEHIKDLKISDGVGVTEVLLESEEDQDIREAVFRAFASADLPILQMRPLDLSLEEIFLNLTTQEES